MKTPATKSDILLLLGILIIISTIYLNLITYKVDKSNIEIMNKLENLIDKTNSKINIIDSLDSKYNELNKL